MLRLDLAFLPPTPTPDVAVVIDVLRMTSTAAVLLSRGVSELAVVAGADAARELAAASGALLLGERGGVPLPGFDFGNSPVELERAELSSSRAVLCTTNGSKAVEAAAAAGHLLLGAVVNDRAVARRALELATTDITFVCSGTDGRVSLEDVVGAGCIIEELLSLAEEANRGVELSDACRMALLLATMPGGAEAGIRRARHAATLESLGFAADIGFCARRGLLEVVPERTALAPARFASSPLMAAGAAPGAERRLS